MRVARRLLVGLFAMTAVVLLGCNSHARATELTNGSKSWQILSNNVNIDVREDGTLSVKVKTKVHFNNNDRVLYVDFPNVEKYKLPDNQGTMTFRPIYSDINANTQYSLIDFSDQANDYARRYKNLYAIGIGHIYDSLATADSELTYKNNEDDYKRMPTLSLGDSKSNFTGDVEYEYSYIRRNGRQNNKYDWMVFDLALGNNYDINSVTNFTINMPKDLNGSELYFSAGDKTNRPSGRDGLTYEMKGRTVTGQINNSELSRAISYEQLNDSINKQEERSSSGDNNLHLALQLPKGYFAKTDVDKNTDWTTGVVAGLAAISLLAVMWPMIRSSRVNRTNEQIDIDGLSDDEVQAILHNHGVFFDKFNVHNNKPGLLVGLIAIAISWLTMNYMWGGLMVIPAIIIVIPFVPVIWLFIHPDARRDYSHLIYNYWYRLSVIFASLSSLILLFPIAMLAISSYPDYGNRNLILMSTIIALAVLLLANLLNYWWRRQTDLGYRLRSQAKQLNRQRVKTPSTMVTGLVLLLLAGFVNLTIGSLMGGTAWAVSDQVVDGVKLIDIYDMDMDQRQALENDDKDAITASNYKVDLRVDRDKTVHVKQRITVDYKNARGGYSNVTVKIPMQQQFRQLGTTNNVMTYSNISNIKVEGLRQGSQEDRWAYHKYTYGKPFYFVDWGHYAHNSDDEYQIQINYDMMYVVSGQRTYTITYDYRPTMLTNQNMLFYDFSSLDVESSPIYEMDFTVKMPNAVDAGDIQLGSMARYNSNNDIEAGNSTTYSVNGDMITGHFSGQCPWADSSCNSLRRGVNSVQPYIQLTMPSNYFIQTTVVDVAKNLTNNQTGRQLLLMMIVCLVALVAVYILWRKYGREPLTTETIQTEPPQGLNSLEIAALYNGFYSNRGVLSLLPYLASRGYISIRLTGLNEIYGHNKYEIIKLKEYDGSDKYEALLFDGLFNTNFDKLLGRADKANGRPDVKTLQERRVAMNDIFKSDIINEHRKRGLDKVIIDGKSPDAQVLAFLVDKIARLADNDRRQQSKANWLTVGVGRINLLICLITIVVLLVAYSALGNLHGVLVGDKPISMFMLVVYALVPVWLYVLAGQRIRTLNKPIWTVVYGLTLAAMVYIYTAPKILLSGDTELNIYGALIGFALVCLTVAILQIAGIYLNKRNSGLSRTVGGVRGYRRYLARVEKLRVDMLDDVNPGNDCEQLAYMYAMRVSDTWTRRLEAYVYNDGTRNKEVKYYM